MIRNIKALLNDDEIHWYHFSTSKFTDEQTVRLFKILNRCDNTKEQMKFLSNVEGGRSTQAEQTLIYQYNNNTVKIKECRYIANKQKFTRGKNIGVINLS